MKKFVAALLCVAAITLVGCKSDPLATGTRADKLTAEQIEKMDNKTEKCWHIAIRVTVNGQTETSDGYEWGTEQEIAAACKITYEAAVAAWKISGVDGKYEIAYSPSSAKDMDSCLAQNKDNK